MNATTPGIQTIVRGAWVMTMAPNRELLRDGAVGIGNDGTVAAVADFSSLESDHPGAEVIGDGNGIVMPGLINAHTHLTECLIPGMAEDATLYEWFERVINPIGYVITRDDVRIGTKLKAVEMLRSGITTVNDMSCHRNHESLASLGAADGLDEIGMRGEISYGAEDVYQDPSPVDSLLAEHEALADRVEASPVLRFRCGLGTVLGTSEELFDRTVAACREHGWRAHTHLSEVREELSGSRTLHGRTTIEQAERQGLLDVELLAAHCIWCTEVDIGLLVSRDVKVSHNPVANMILASGVCPVPRLRSAGVAVGLGTDGAASNDNQDMFGVLKAAGLIHKLHALDAAAIKARDVMQMATIEGARALDLDSITGSLEEGKRADVVLLDGNTPELATIHDPWQQVVYCATARCVSDVWVDGRRRVHEGEVVGADLKTLANEARTAGADLAARAGLASESKLFRAGEGAKLNPSSQGP